MLHQKIGLLIVIYESSLGIQKLARKRTHLNLFYSLAIADSFFWFFFLNLYL